MVVRATSVEASKTGDNGGGRRGKHDDDDDRHPSLEAAAASSLGKPTTLTSVGSLRELPVR